MQSQNTQSLPDSISNFLSGGISFSFFSLSFSSEESLLLHSLSFLRILFYHKNKNKKNHGREKSTLSFLLLQFYFIYISLSPFSFPLPSLSNSSSPLLFPTFPQIFLSQKILPPSLAFEKRGPLLLLLRETPNTSTGASRSPCGVGRSKPGRRTRADPSGG